MHFVIDCSVTWRPRGGNGVCCTVQTEYIDLQCTQHILLRTQWCRNFHAVHALYLDVETFILLLRHKSRNLCNRSNCSPRIILGKISLNVTNQLRVDWYWYLSTLLDVCYTMQKLYFHIIANATWFRHFNVDKHYIIICTFNPKRVHNFYTKYAPQIIY